MPSTSYIKLDSRKRALLGANATTDEYLMTVGDNGRIVLEPAVVMTEVEQNYLLNHDAQSAVKRALANPDDVVRGPRRRPAA